MRRRFPLLLVAILACVLPFGALAQGTPAATTAAAAPPFGYANLYSDLHTGITSSNVGQLGLAWAIPTDEPVSGAPIVADGHVYFADWSGTVYAAAAKDGKIFWKKQVEKSNDKWPWYGFAGPGTLADGTLFFASVEGDAFALDPDNGDVKWHQHFAAHPMAGSVGRILAYDGLLFIGEESVEEGLTLKMPNYRPTFTGAVVALDTKTGKQVWKLPTVRPPANGVAVWSGFALDPDTNTLFFATGNNYTGPPSDMSDALVAVDAKTGTIRWARQTFQRDVWTPREFNGPDYDFGAAPQLFEATVNGKTVKLVGDGQKSGVYWAFDRASGDVVWKTVIGFGGIAGGIRGAASIADGKIVAWSNNYWTDTLGEPADPRAAPITIKALDTGTGSVRWYIYQAQPAIGSSSGVLANDVYLAGSLDGQVYAYAATTGKPLWTSPPQGSVGADLVVANDTLYVGAGVPAAFGGHTPFGLFAYRPGATGTPAANPPAGMPKRGPGATATPTS